MNDPYAHGTPAGDHHTWVDPGQRDCPNCPCCTVRLCRTAAQAAQTCSQFVASLVGTTDVSGCPCTAAHEPDRSTPVILCD